MNGMFCSFREFLRYTNFIQKNNLMKILFQLVVLMGLSQIAFGQSWSMIETKNNCTERQECSGAAEDGKLYPGGGRGDKPVEESDPATQRWRTVCMPPMASHRVEAGSYKEKVYIIGSSSGA